MKERKRKRWI